MCRYESRGYSAPSFGVNCPPLDVGSSELALLQGTCTVLLSDPVATVAVSAAVSIPRLLPCFHPETRATLAFTCFSIIQRLVRESNYWGTYHSLGSAYVDVLSSALRVLPALQEFGCGALSPPSLDSFLGAVVYEPAVQIRCVMPAVLCALARGSAKTDGSADMLENFFLAFLKDDQSEVICAIGLCYFARWSPLAVIFAAGSAVVPVESRSFLAVSPERERGVIRTLV
jgi:hypothetical protein